MSEHPEESDQLPEEAPAEQVPDDASGRREGAHESPGAGEDPKRATGGQDDDHGED